MYHILLPVGSDPEEASRTAEHLISVPIPAEEFHVTILNVFREFDGVEGDVRVSSEELYDESELPQSVTSVVEFLESNDVSTEVARRHGDPADEIATFARENSCDLIVVGGRKQSPVGKMIFGSVAQEVLLQADQPVTVVMSE